MRILIGLLASAIALSPAAAIAQEKNPSSSTESEGVVAAAQAIGDVDTERLFSDKTYAAEILGHADTLRASDRYAGDVRPAIDSMRMFALMGLGRTKDAHDQARAIMALEPTSTVAHYFAFVLATDLGGDVALRQLEEADRTLTGASDRAAFAEDIDIELIHHFRQPFYLASDRAKLARSAELLMRFGLPGPDHPALTDSFRFAIADDKLATGDVAGARSLIHTIQAVNPVLTTLIAKRWLPTLQSEDPAQRLAQAIVAADESSAERARSKPDDLKLLLARAQHLRSVGKDQEALDLLQPRIRDLEWVKQKGEDAYWLVNEAAYALNATNRSREAVEQFDRLLSIGLDKEPVLISMAINKVGVLGEVDHKQAAEYAGMLADKHSDIASPYGQMWMWSGAACSYALANDISAASPYLDKLRKGETTIRRR